MTAREARQKLLEMDQEDFDSYVLEFKQKIKPFMSSYGSSIQVITHIIDIFKKIIIKISKEEDKILSEANAKIKGIYSVELITVNRFAYYPDGLNIIKPRKYYANGFGLVVGSSCYDYTKVVYLFILEEKSFVFDKTNYLLLLDKMKTDSDYLNPNEIKPSDEAEKIETNSENKIIKAIYNYIKDDGVINSYLEKLIIDYKKRNEKK